MMPRFSSQAGIAIGPILFVIALLAVLATYFASDTGGMGSAGREDSITAQLSSQANLIRSKFNECNMVRGTWPAGDGDGTILGDVECPGDPPGLENMWSGARPSQIAPPPQGFGAWTYYDYSGAGGGRCVRIMPGAPSDPAVKNGIRRAYGKFTSQEAGYDANGGNQSFVIWITTPSGSAGANCTAD